MSVEPIAEDFQIVIEAKPMSGFISDIAIDDVALLSGSHCERFFRNETTVTDEPIGVYDVMSCLNRCNESESSRNAAKFKTDSITGKQVELCDCHDQCADLGTCCLDYSDYCFTDSSK